MPWRFWAERPSVSETNPKWTWTNWNITWNNKVHHVRPKSANRKRQTITCTNSQYIALYLLSATKGNSHSWRLLRFEENKCSHIGPFEQICTTQWDRMKETHSIKVKMDNYFFGVPTWTMSTLFAKTLSSCRNSSRTCAWQIAWPPSHMKTKICSYSQLNSCFLTI